MATFTSNGTPITQPSPQYDLPIVSNNGVLKARHKSGLPLGYQLYEYITADGNQWLDTGIKLASTDIVEAEFKNSSSTGYGALYGVYAMGDSSAFYANGTYYGYNETNGKVDTGISVDTSWHTLRFDYINGVIILDGNNTTYTPFEFENTKDNYLFARYYSSSYGYGFKGSCKRYKVIRNGVLICDLIPVVQLSNNAVGMYDLVNNVFRDNLGTGAFDISNPVSDIVKIYTDGTTETVSVHSQNLFNKATRTTNRIINATTGQETLNSDKYCSDYIVVKPNTTYSCNGFDDSSAVNGIAFYDKDKVYVSGIPYSVTIVNQKKITVPNNSTIKYARFGSYNITSADDCMFVESSTLPTAYEPYYYGGSATAEMLLKVGDVKDVQSVLDGVITKNVGILILDGTESWSVASGTGFRQFYSSATQGVVANSVSLMSNIAPYGCTASTRTDYQYGCYSGSSGNLCFQMIGSSTINTTTDWTNYLSGQYQNNTPVIVIYPKSTATTETVTGQHLTVQHGTNIVEITQASIDGLSLEVSYKQQQ